MGEAVDKGEVRRAFSRRLHDVVDRIAETAETEIMLKVLGTSDPLSGMGIVMQHAVTDEAMQARDPLMGARLRGIEARKRLIRSAGGLLRLSEAAERLEVTPQAVTGRRSRGTILAVPTASGEWVYPACQFGDHGLIPGIDAFLKAFDEDVDHWTRLAVLLATSDRFGMSAMALLEEGRDEDALSIAGTYGEQA